MTGPSHPRLPLFYESGPIAVGSRSGRIDREGDRAARLRAGSSYSRERRRDRCRSLRLRRPPDCETSLYGPWKQLQPGVADPLPAAR